MQRATENVQQPTHKVQQPKYNVQQPTDNVQQPKDNVQQIRARDTTCNMQRATDHVPQPTNRRDGLVRTHDELDVLTNTFQLRIPLCELRPSPDPSEENGGEGLTWNPQLKITDVRQVEADRYGHGDRWRNPRIRHLPLLLRGERRIDAPELAVAGYYASLTAVRVCWPVDESRIIGYSCTQCQHPKCVCIVPVEHELA
jgi:hypothetical protein